MNEQKKLTSKQTKTITALLQYPTIEAAAKSAGVTSRTIRNWLHDADFTAALHAAQLQLLDAHLASLSASLAAASAVYAELLNSDDDAIRLRAADSLHKVFDSTWQRRLAIREAHDFAERLETAERTIVLTRGDAE